MPVTQGWEQRFHQEKVQAKRQWNNIFKVLERQKTKKTLQPRILCRVKISFKTKAKDFFRYIKAERILYWQMFTTRNVKGSAFSRGKMIQGGNMDIYKKVKSTRHGNYMGKYVRFLLFKLLLSKIDSLKKNKNNVLWGL